jgi:Pyruvate/2-oxoacid:ferredoxin oxidoreductase delta subunit
VTVSDAGGMRVVVRRDDAGGVATGRPADLMRALLERGYAVSFVRSSSDDTHDAAAARQEPSADVSMMLETLDRTREQRGLQRAGAWKPWFPVVDYQRCTNCMQCLSFCLFDVYGVSPEGKLKVQNQSNCKTECPACSRVCPEVAIMFPKYRHGPINGEEVSTDDVRREAMKVDISALLGGDIYSMLRDRSTKAKSRFSKERDDERALKERQTCLVKLQEAFDVPPEVLAALPTVDEIRAKAEAALARARAVMSPEGSAPRDAAKEPGRATGETQAL